VSTKKRYLSVDGCLNDATTIIDVSRWLHRTQPSVFRNNKWAVLNINNFVFVFTYTRIIGTRFIIYNCTYFVCSYYTLVPSKRITSYARYIYVLRYTPSRPPRGVIISVSSAHCIDIIKYNSCQVESVRDKINGHVIKFIYVFMYIIVPYTRAVIIIIFSDRTRRYDGDGPYRVANAPVAPYIIEKLTKIELLQRPPPSA